MPQFHLDNFVPQLVWLTIFFAILYFGIVQTTLPRLGRTIAAREDQVTGDIATAEAAKQSADAMAAAHAVDIDAAHKAARSAVEAARGRAATNVEAAVKAANAATAERAAVADAALSAARTRAMGEIEVVAAEAVGDIVERLTGRRPNRALAQSAAQSALAA